MNLFLQLMIGGGIIVLTVAIHGLVLDSIIKHAPLLEKLIRHLNRVLWRPLLSSLIVLLVFLSHIIHIWLWTFLYMGLDSLPVSNLENALYFSTVTYTTLGYGDIVPKAGYSILSGVEAANGLLLIGWTTAFIFEITAQLYRREVKSL